MFSRIALSYCGTLVLALTALCLIPEAFGDLDPLAGVSQVAEHKPREEFPRNRFEPRPEGSLVTLRYWFQDKDKGGIERDVSCQIDDRKSASLRRGLGLKVCPKGRPSASADQPLSACVRGNAIEWQGRPAASAPATGRKTYPYAQYMLERGLRCHEGQLVLDYPSLILKATPSFEDCIQKLNTQLAGDPGTTEDLRLLMQFFLAMRSEDVLKVDQKSQTWTGGYLFPSDVLSQNTGDCDSKASAFCAVKRGAHRFVIFRSVHLKEHSEHGHAFLGLDVTSSDLPLRNEGMWTGDGIEAGEYDKIKPLEFWGRSYIPIDATGPGDTRLGEVVPDKAGQYVAIPIPSGGRIPPAADESCLVDRGARSTG